MIFRSIVFNFALFIKFLNVKYWKVEVFVNRARLIWFSLSNFELAAHGVHNR